MKSDEKKVFTELLMKLAKGPFSEANSSYRDVDESVLLTSLDIGYSQNIDDSKQQLDRRRTFARELLIKQV